MRSLVLAAITLLSSLLPPKPAHGAPSHGDDSASEPKTLHEGLQDQILRLKRLQREVFTALLEIQKRLEGMEGQGDNEDVFIPFEGRLGLRVETKP